MSQIHTNYTIGVVEDEPKYREGILNALEGQPGITKIKTWESAEEFWRYRKIKELDLILMDIQLGGMNGVDLTRRVYSRYEKPIVMLTSMADDESIFESLKAGAVGYLLKLDMDNLYPLVQQVMAGGGVMSPQIAFKVSQFFRKAPAVPMDAKLTDAEENVLKEVVRGKNNQKIADGLLVSVNTVKFHIRNIYKKLNVCNRASLAEAAIKQGLV